MGQRKKHDITRKYSENCTTNVICCISSTLPILKTINRQTVFYLVFHTRTKSSAYDAPDSGRKYRWTPLLFCKWKTHLRRLVRLAPASEHSSTWKFHSRMCLFWIETFKKKKYSDNYMFLSCIELTNYTDFLNGKFLLSYLFFQNNNTT